MAQIADSIAGVRELIAQAGAALVETGAPQPRISLVATMGALHSGHAALIEQAARLGDIVVVSIFVNPIQFTAPRDLERYPRDLTADVATIESLQIARPVIVFAPSAREMYPRGSTSTIVSAGHVGTLFEGGSRPGHFDGVLTVVAKLLHIVSPDTVVFGRKDAQQAFLVDRMLEDLDFATAIEVVDTVREADGLALSSRNRFLDENERRASVVLSRMLDAAGSAARGRAAGAGTDGGAPAGAGADAAADVPTGRARDVPTDRGVTAVIAAARSVATGEPLVQVDYLAVVDPASFLPVDDGYRGRAIVLVAATVGSTRLIDNEVISLG